MRFKNFQKEIIACNFCQSTSDEKKNNCKSFSKNASSDECWKKDPTSETLRALEKSIQILRQKCPISQFLLVISPAERSDILESCNLISVYGISTFYQTCMTMLHIKNSEFEILRNSNILNAFRFVLTSTYFNPKEELGLNLVLNAMTTSIDASDCVECQARAKQTDNAISIIIQKINCNSAKVYSRSDDLSNFFALFEKLKLKCFIRPDFKNQSSDDVFILECFNCQSGYLGSITLDSYRILKYLRKNTCFMTNCLVVTDVSEIVLPKFVVRSLQKIAAWLGVQLFYDSFVEFVFYVYKMAH